MDAYYTSQMGNTFQGPARQFGSGAGIGAFALRVGRTAMPLVKKYVGPFVKQVGQNVLEAALPEVVSLIKGKKKFRKAIEDSTKNALKKTRAAAGGATPGSAAAAGRAGGGGPRRPSGQKRKHTDSVRATAGKTVISSKKPAKRSRVDILANVKFNGGPK